MRDPFANSDSDAVLKTSAGQREIVILAVMGVVFSSRRIALAYRERLARLRDGDAARQ